MVMEIQFIPERLTENLDKVKYSCLLEYCKNLNGQLVSSKVKYEDLKADKVFNTLDSGLLEELLKIEEEKFGNIRQESNIHETTNEVIKTINDYMSHGRILGETCGLPGSGKTTFTSKHFPNNYICIDAEIKKVYENYDFSNLDYNESRRRQEGLRNQIEKNITQRLINDSIIIDTLYNLKTYRQENFERIKEYNSTSICFMFDSHSQTCHERMAFRRKTSETQVYHLSSLIYFLLSFESPLSKELTPELGIDLILTINKEGTIMSGYPYENYELLKEQKIIPHKGWNYWN
ncbi:MAG: AAA family ATPase [Candidatus Nanoarchaeia archaeon]|nr:AAA family ATPase [Candidatus Nanoarchaeia archaeon]